MVTGDYRRVMVTMMGPYLAFLISALVTGILISPVALGATTATFDTKTFDTTVAQLHQASGVPGLAVAVLKDGATVFAKGYGIAGPDKRPVTVDTVFQIGSITKAFVALVIQQLAVEGKLRFDAPVVTYLADFRTADITLSNRITVDDLLTHRSGLTTLAGNGGITADQSLSGPKAVVRGLANSSLSTQPGYAFQYSNANYVVLSHLIETLDQRSFEQALEARIFEPLNMTHSHVATAPSDDMHMATPYRLWFSWPVPWLPAPKYPPDRTMIGAGGIVSSINDLAVFVEAVRSKDPRVVPPSAERLFVMRPFWESWGYGYGWFTQRLGTERVFEHSGLTPGFFTLATHLPDSDATVVVLTNQSGLAQGDLPRAVVNAALGREPVAVQSPIMARLAVWSALMAPLGLLVLLIKTLYLLHRSEKGGAKIRRLFNAMLGMLLVIGSITGYTVYPRLMNLDYDASLAYFPDLTLTLIAGLVMALLCGLSRLVLSLRS